MKFITLSGHVISKAIVIQEPDKFRSKFEEKVYEKLTERYKYDIILYEWRLPGNQRLSLDFYLPRRNLAIECDGKQHKKFNKFFHGSPRKLIDQKQNDLKKDQFCKINDILLIRLDDAKEMNDYPELC